MIPTRLILRHFPKLRFTTLSSPSLPTRSRIVLSSRSSGMQELRTVATIRSRSITTNARRRNDEEDNTRNREAFEPADLLPWPTFPPQNSLKGSSRSENTNAESTDVPYEVGGDSQGSGAAPAADADDADFGSDMDIDADIDLGDIFSP